MQTEVRLKKFKYESTFREACSVFRNAKYSLVIRFLLENYLLENQIKKSLLTYEIRKDLSTRKKYVD